MNEKQHNILIVSVLFSVVLLMWTSLCSGEEQESLQSLEKKVATLEDTWRTGATNEYYDQASELASEILALDEKTNMTAAAPSQLLLSLVSKEANPCELGADDLWIMKKLAWYLTCNTNANDNMTNNVVILSKFLGKLRKDRIPNYQWKRTTPNVRPPRIDPNTRDTNKYPDKYPGRYSGMDPAAIGDPHERSIYEAAIRENSINTRINSQQRALKDIESYFLNSIMNYMIRTFSTTSSDMLEKCMEDARLTEEEKTAVRNGIIEEKARAAAIETQIEQPQPVRKERR